MAHKSGGRGCSKVESTRIWSNCSRLPSRPSGQPRSRGVGFLCRPLSRQAVGIAGRKMGSFGKNRPCDFRARRWRLKGGAVPDGPVRRGSRAARSGRAARRRPVRVPWSLGARLKTEGSWVGRRRFTNKVSHTGNILARTFLFRSCGRRRTIIEPADALSARNGVPPASALPNGVRGRGRIQNVKCQELTP